jgi:four helix bundle protein
MGLIELEDLNIYRRSMELADRIWQIAVGWNNTAKHTIGYQIIRSADSIAANISEGYGRYFYKETRQFCYIARGSLYETKTFLTKSYMRKLISESDYNELNKAINELTRMLNSFIKYIEEKIKQK